MGLILVSVLLFVVMQASFATDNQTDVISEDMVDEEVSESPVKHIYFDSNATTDGDGSASNPYKDLEWDRIEDNSYVHLADGEYSFNPYFYSNVTIEGSGSQNTIINGFGGEMDVNGTFVIKDVTAVQMPIKSFSTITAINTVFKYSTGLSWDNLYNNSYGGAIHSWGDVYLSNCQFIENTAVYGGAIYVSGANLEIENCIFRDNFAYTYGGAIASEYADRVKIRNSKFINSQSGDDAGGAIYIRESVLDAEDVEIINSSANFGAAITLIDGNATFYNLNLVNNTARYDGGAIYQLYGTLALRNSNIISNTAENGAGLFAGSCDYVLIENSHFNSNRALNCAGAMYSILNNNITFLRNTLNDNVAQVNNDVFRTDEINLFIGNSNSTLYTYNSDYNGTLPKYYRISGLNIKDQEDGGNCWAFATMALMESVIQKASGENIRLSEENIKNLMARYSYYGWNYPTNFGGHIGMSVGYLTSWLGPVMESSDVYDGSSTLSPVIDSVVHVQNVLFLSRSSYTDNDAIKRAILDYGAVLSGMYTPEFMGVIPDYDGVHQYYSGSERPNHDIIIVGWDDNYSKDNFRQTPPGDGAWIAKNSWGTRWGDAENPGYFYISYYDESCLIVNDTHAAYTVILNDTIIYDKNYQYDIPGERSFFKVAGDTVWYKNRFIATDDEYLAAVSTYFENPAQWTAYVNVSGELKSSLSGFSNRGYFTFDLKEFIPLKKGDEFEVIFKINSSASTVLVPFANEAEYNYIFANGNVSFMSADGEDWEVFSPLCVASIKAFTVFDYIDSNINIDAVRINGTDYEITASVINQYGYLMKTGEVLFTIDNQNYPVNITDGVAKIKMNFDVGPHEISAEYGAVNYVTSHNSTVLNVKYKTEMKMDISTYLNNANITVTLSQPINENVQIIVAGKTYNVRLSNGIVKLPLTGLNYGLNDITVKLQSDVYSAEDISSSFNLEMLGTKIVANNLETYYNSDDLFKIILTDSNGKALANQLVEYKVNSKSYTNSTDANGQIAVSNNFDVGAYPVEIKFRGSEDYLPSNSSANIIVKSTITLQGERYNANQNYTVAVVDKSGGFLNNNKVVIAFAGKTNDVISKMGVANVKLDVSPGIYVVKVENTESGEIKYQNVSVLDEKGNVVDRFIDVNGEVKYDNTPGSDVNGSSDPVKPDVNGSSDPVKPDVNGSSDPVKPDVNGSSDPVKPDVNGSTNPVKPDGNGSSNPVKPDVNGSSNPVTPPVQPVANVIKLSGNTNVVMYYGANKYYAVKVLVNGKAVKNLKVLFTVNGKKVYAYTNAKGVASVKLSLKPGKYTVTAKYGDKSVKNVVTVKSTIITSNLVVKKGKAITFTAKLLNSNGKILKYKKLVVKFMGKTYYPKTSKKGIAVLKITKKYAVGKYTITTKYGSLTVKNTIKIRK